MSAANFLDLSIVIEGQIGPGVDYAQPAC
jgi:hypothetical protein